MTIQMFKTHREKNIIKLLPSKHLQSPGSGVTIPVTLAAGNSACFIGVFALFAGPMPLFIMCSLVNIDSSY